jgi:hypothetical protein
MYYSISVVMTEVRDISLDAEVRLRTVQTLLRRTHLSFAKLNVKTTVHMGLDGVVATDTIRCQWSLENAAPRFTFSKPGSTHSLRRYLIILHMFAMYLIAQ